MTELAGKIEMQRLTIALQRKQIDQLQAALLIADAQIVLKEQLLQAYRERDARGYVQTGNNHNDGSPDRTATTSNRASARNDRTATGRD